MAIILDQNSKIIVQGMTGSEGMKHTPVSYTHLTLPTIYSV